MKTGEAAGDLARKLPARVETTRERFEKWRSERPSRACPIPTDLWAAAARCARQLGYCRTAQVLGLDSGKLKRQAEALVCHGRRGNSKTGRWGNGSRSIYSSRMFFKEILK